MNSTAAGEEIEAILLDFPTRTRDGFCWEQYGA